MENNIANTENIELVWQDNLLVLRSNQNDLMHFSFSGAERERFNGARQVAHLPPQLMSRAAEIWAGFLQAHKNDLTFSRLLRWETTYLKLNLSYEELCQFLFQLIDSSQKAATTLR